MTPERPAHPASYRDPAGHVFRTEDAWHRHVNDTYAAHYDRLMQSGLYDALTAKRMLVSHTETATIPTKMQGAYKILRPEQIPFISYPAEWSPRQLKSAALLTLGIMQEAIARGMILKDATPLNIQFVDGAALFIDTLSFEQYDGATPWIAYRQFCENFLFPLYINHYLATGTHKLFNAWPEGIDAATTASLLPRKSRFRLGVWLHVLLQRNIQRRNTRPATGAHPAFTTQKLKHLLQNLQEIITGLDTREDGRSTWNDYYTSTILSQQYLEAKASLFREFLADIDPVTALDLGANDGYFSRIMAERMPRVIAADFDWRCIDRLSRLVDEQKIGNILPLCIDITHPTPANGFRNTEQPSFISRARSPLVTALALIHHLAIGKNIPLPNLAAFFADISSDTLIIEFIPLGDEKVQELLNGRGQYHKPYDEAAFESAFSPYFTILKNTRIKDTGRTLYLLKKIQ